MKVRFTLLVQKCLELICFKCINFRCRTKIKNHNAGFNAELNLIF